MLILALILMYNNLILLTLSFLSLKWVDRRVHQLCSMPRKEDADAYAKNHLDINRITYACEFAPEMLIIFTTNN